MANNDRPKDGDIWECSTCGMALEITKDCQCEDGGPFFSCCDKQMEQTGSTSDTES